MNTSVSVLGVQGCVGFVLAGLHKEHQLFSRPAGICVECVGLSRTRAHAHETCPANQPEKNSPCEAQKACTPYTPCTILINSLSLLGFKCVGSVLGWAVCVLGWDLLGSSGHEC